MDVKVIILCIETALLVILIIGFIAACASSLKWHMAYKTLYSSTKRKNSGADKNDSETGADSMAATEPAGYVRGIDRFLDTLTSEERQEFYQSFINGNRCGLQYKAGGNNSGFFSGVFINLSSVRYVVSDSLMHKICEEYDRLRGMPVTADNK